MTRILVSYFRQTQGAKDSAITPDDKRDSRDLLRIARLVVETSLEQLLGQLAPRRGATDDATESPQGSVYARYFHGRAGAFDPAAGQVWGAELGSVAVGIVPIVPAWQAPVRNPLAAFEAIIRAEWNERGVSE